MFQIYPEIKCADLFLSAKLKYEHYYISQNAITYEDTDNTYEDLTYNKFTYNFNKWDTYPFLYSVVSEVIYK
jgi:hypothetical protein